MISLYNTLTRKIEEFKPLDPPNVKMYACGPTVYDYQHIGHMRRYIGDDILVRVLTANGYNVKHVMNITDVGHLTSDADTGEDKMEKGAKKLGLSVWDVAKKFEKQFFDSMEKLNIKMPDVIMHATDYIKQQIELVQILEEKGFTYKADDGIYFDTSKLSDYGKLTGQNREELKAGARIEMVEDKKNATDFALWKFSPDSASRRQMEWESPWGVGFPGWHIECSAMSMTEFGPTLDIHSGGIDHIAIHHTNEIAQSEAASGKEFVKYWVHHGFLSVGGEKMSKSLGNFYTVEDIMKNGLDPMSLRYLYLQTHYRQPMNFTWEALEGAQNALNRLRGEISGADEGNQGCAEFEQKFMDALNDDLNAPNGLAVVWDLLRSNYPKPAKLNSLYKMDEVLGLNLKQVQAKKPVEIPLEIQNMVKEREELRKQKRFHLADQLRNKIKKLGFDIRDTDDGETEIRKI